MPAGTEKTMEQLETLFAEVLGEIPNVFTTYLTQISGDLANSKSGMMKAKRILMNTKPRYVVEAGEAVFAEVVRRFNDYKFNEETGEWEKKQ